MRMTFAIISCCRASKLIRERVNCASHPTWQARPSKWASSGGEQVTTDWAGLIDEWAGRFFAELDYEAEARNAAVFKRQMAQLEGITVAEVLPALSSRTVLTTDWVSGARRTLPVLLHRPATSVHTLSCNIRLLLEALCSSACYTMWPISDGMHTVPLFSL